SRSSNSSGGCDIRVANRNSDLVVITPTIWQRRWRALTDLRAVISYLTPESEGNRAKSCVCLSMLARKQELNTQIQQLIDSFVLALSLLAAHSLRLYGTD